MPSRPLGLLLVVSLGLVLAVALSAYQYCGRQFPYYFLWDQDHILNLDTLLVQSGMLPDHLAHPGFGVNLVASRTQPLGHALGLFSALDLRDLEQSLQPIACMAERGDFVRDHSPFLALGIALALWSAICLWWNPTWDLKLLALVALCAQEALLYQACMIRTELYAVFFWSLGVLLLALADRWRPRRSSIAALFAGGVFLGLAFQTKLQALLYVAAAPIFVWVVSTRTNDDGSANESSKTLPRAPWSLMIACFNLAAFFLLLRLAKREVIPAGVATFTQSFQVIPLTMLVLAGLAGLVVLNYFLPADGTLRDGVHRITVLIFGALASFSLHFLVFSDPTLSWQYLLQDFKMLFLSQKFYAMKSTDEYWRKTIDLLTYDPIPYLVLGASGALLGIAWAAGAVSLARRQTLAIAALICLTGANLVIGVRAIQRDTLWTATLVNVVSVMILCLVTSQASGQRVPWRVAATVLALVLAASNLYQSSNLLAKLDALYVSYGWRDEFFLQGIYGHNQPKYTALMRNRYRDSKPESLARARNLAARHDAAARITRFVFPDRPIPLTHVGVADVDQPVWRERPDARIQRLPDAFRGGLVVDPMGIAANRTFFTMPRDIFKEDEELVRRGKSGGGSTIRVRPRADLRIHAFQRASETPLPALDPDLATLTLATPSFTIECVGLPITNEIELPIDPRNPLFFVVRHRLDDF